MPATMATLWGSMPRSTSAFCSAARTPKSPQPGHHQDFSLVLKSASLGIARHLFGLRGDLLGQERVPVVLPHAVHGRHRQALLPHGLADRSEEDTSELQSRE